MLTIYTARDLKADEILCISIHPGWVRTDMGGDKVNLESVIKESLRTEHNMRPESHKYTDGLFDNVTLFKMHVIPCLSTRRPLMPEKVWRE